MNDNIDMIIKKRKIFVILLLIVLFVGIFLVYIIFLPSKSNSGKKENNTKKIERNSLFVKVEDGQEGNNHFVVPYGIEPNTAVYKSINKNDLNVSFDLASNKISFGDTVIIPEYTALVSMCNGEVTSELTTSGTYLFKESAGVISPQKIYYVNLKEMGLLNFFMPLPVEVDDISSNKKISVLLNGKYSIKVVKPGIFVETYDLTDTFNWKGLDAEFSINANIIGSELISAMPLALQNYSKKNNINNISNDVANFKSYLLDAVKEKLDWANEKGLELIDISDLVLVIK